MGMRMFKGLWTMSGIYKVFPLPAGKPVEQSTTRREGFDEAPPRQACRRLDAATRPVSGSRWKVACGSHSLLDAASQAEARYQLDGLSRPMLRDVESKPLAGELAYERMK
jgi:hypothetical protein